MVRASVGKSDAPAPTIDGRSLLNRLLDKIERQPDRTRRIQERLPDAFISAEARAACRAILEDAARAGAVELVNGRGETRHLIERVFLTDPDALYRFLDRTPAADLAVEAAATLRSQVSPSSPHANRALEEIVLGWTEGRHPLGIGREDVGRAARFVTVLDAVLKRQPTDRSDMRTFSRLRTGNSKYVEEMTRPIADFMRRAGLADPTLEDDDVLKGMGLEKFPQPVLIAGPICVRDADFSGLVYGGAAPENAASIVPVGPIQSVLTIENFATFNRHVREAKRPADLVIYTGGFPSRSVIAALEAIASWNGGPFHHWGDIDQGGIAIALHLCRTLRVPVLPHLMDADTARRRGTLGNPIERGQAEIPEAWASLADFLCGPECRFLEQEEIDPLPPS
jgi:hypothetical protein